MTTPAPARPDVAHRVFSDGRLSIGLTLPLLRTGHIVADFDEQLELSALADTLGFRALWIRDVPLNSADYPDPVGHLDPWVLLGTLASRTRRIALASGAIVLPLRHPLHIAKGALSVATLSGGRFVLGLGSGDRPPEYAAFGVDAQTRRDRYRAHWDVVAAALGVPSARMRREVFVVASFATGAMVAVSGAIGFVGLVTPHLCRRVVGAEHGRLLPVAALTGAILLVWADVAARTLAAPEDLPIGIVTAMFGSLFFVALLRRR